MGVARGWGVTVAFRDATTLVLKALRDRPGDGQLRDAWGGAGAHASVARAARARPRGRARAWRAAPTPGGDDRAADPFKDGKERHARVPPPHPAAPCARSSHEGDQGATRAPYTTMSARRKASSAKQWVPRLVTLEDSTTASSPPPTPPSSRQTLGQRPLSCNYVSCQRRGSKRGHSKPRAAPHEARAAALSVSFMNHSKSMIM